MRWKTIFFLKGHFIQIKDYNLSNNFINCNSKTNITKLNSNLVLFVALEFF